MFIKSTLQRIFQFILLNLLLLPAFASPFGLIKGLTIQAIEEATGQKPIQEKNVFIISPPKTHPSFDQYFVRINEKVGLYYIKAIGKPISTSVYGSELLSEYQTVLAGVRKTYGVPKEYNFLKAGSIWSEPNDWMMGLLKKERVLMSVWSINNGLILPDNIKQIILVGVALKQDTGYIVLEYYFDNYDEAVKLEKEKVDSVF